MLTRLHVRDFKSLRDLDVRFGPLTVLVGPNGCGKTSVLQAIEVLRDVILRGGEDESFPVGVVSRPIENEPAAESIHIRLELSGARDVSVEAVLTPTGKTSGFFDKKRTSVVCRSLDEEFVQRWTRHPMPEWVSESFTPIQLYRLDTQIMERPAYSEEPEPHLGTRGENLGAVLDALQGTRREVFDGIEAQLCTFIPGLRRVRLQRVKTPVVRTVSMDQSWRQIRDEVIGHQVVLDFEFARSVVADQASEGTILLLGLLTIIGVTSDHPMTVMLDDLDRALHPKAQQQLVEHLHQLIAQRPELQIIATSHSPYLVEHLAYEEVVAMTQDPNDGRSLAAPLADHPEAARWREEMSAGEFWSTVGERWISSAKEQPPS